MPFSEERAGLIRKRGYRQGSIRRSGSCDLNDSEVAYYLQMSEAKTVAETHSLD